MLAKDLTTEFPDINIEQKFKDKEKQALNSGTPTEAVSDKRNEYSKLFVFDGLIDNVNKSLRANKEQEISESIVSRIRNLISRQAVVLNALDSLDYSNPGDVNQVFTPLQNELSNQNFFQEILINFNSGTTVSRGISYVDWLIQEATDLIHILNLEFLSKTELIEVKTLANSIVKNRKRYSQATEIADNWIKTNERAILTSLKKRSKNFAEKADEHRTYNPSSFFKPSGSYLWLVSAAILGGTVITFLLLLPNIFPETDDTFTLGGLSKILIVAIPTYFALFSIGQFSTHRRLHEAYKFREISLEVFGELIKQFPDPNEKTKILEKAIAIIFSEPSLKKDDPSTSLMKEINKLARRNT